MMVFFTIQEIFDIVFMSVVIGYIFKDYIKIPKKIEVYPYLTNHPKVKIFDKRFKDAVIVVAPAIIIHELFHKFCAMAFHLNATFHAAYTWLLLALLIKLAGINFIFIVPAFVSISGSVNSPYKDLIFALIAFAGPLANLIMFLLAKMTIQKQKLMDFIRKYIKLTEVHIYYMYEINKMLFFFNMLPIPFFDGFKVYSGILKFLLKSVF